MGTRENGVENYLKDKAKAELGAVTRKWVSPGRIGVPDQLVIVPLEKEEAHRLVDLGLLCALVVPVEVKTEDGVLTSAQSREQTRLRDAGLPAITAKGHRGVDSVINLYKGLLKR